MFSNLLYFTNKYYAVVGYEPSYDLALDIQKLYSALNGRDRRIVDMLAEGLHIVEIANELNCTSRSVQRRIRAIRDKWNILIKE